MFQMRIKWVWVGCILIGIIWLVLGCIKKTSTNINGSADHVTEIYLPNVSKQPVALDLESGRLVDIHCTGEKDHDNPDFVRALKDLKSGDIFFDLSHLELLTAEYKTASHNDNTTWPRWYKIPRFLPYAMIVTTEHGKAYNINVMEKTDNGILLLYQQTTEGASPEMLDERYRDEVLLRRLFSANRLNELDRTLSIYNGNWDDKYPETLKQLEPYWGFRQDVEWIYENVEYPGNVKDQTWPLESVLAYDRTMLEEENSQGTNVLYKDSQILFRSKAELSEVDGVQ